MPGPTAELVPAAWSDAVALSDLTKTAVDSTLAEFDEIGREAFLRRYGFGEARRYFLLRDGKRYDSKAIAGVAHGRIDQNHAMLKNSDFTGGEGSVATPLRRIGYEVVVDEAGAEAGRKLDPFAVITARALEQLEGVRSGPYARMPELWASMDDLTASLGSLRSMRARPQIFAKWSLGKGVWAKVPWVALMNRNVTTSTQHGLYIVMLVAEDLSRLYLTLNQGMTELVQEHGQAGAVSLLKDRAAKYRTQVGELEQAGFTLSDAIDLRTDNWRAKNYQPSTIAFAEFTRDDLPSDDKLEALLEPLLAAYDRLAQADNEEPEVTVEDEEDEAEAAPYTLEDALQSVFLGLSFRAERRSMSALTSAPIFKTCLARSSSMARTA